jgi:Arc/MetJ-type ribon-helix-helix transcriptional regulator
MPKVTVEVPQHMLDDLEEHIGDNKKFINWSDAIRTSIRKTLDMIDDIDARHDRIKKEDE